MTPKAFSLEEINQFIKGIIVGSTSQKIFSPQQLESATENEISFIGNKEYERLWAKSNASVAIVNEDITIEPGENRAFIKVKMQIWHFVNYLNFFAKNSNISSKDTSNGSN